MTVERVLLAEPRGFCAGVEMAIKALTWMTRIFEPPVYCYHEIVHNEWVVRAFERVGVVFVDDIAQVPQGAPVMLSAHGSAPEVIAAAQERAAVVIDAVCPLVTKVHHEVKQLASKGYDIIYIGHHGHDEAVGTVAEAPEAITLVEPETGIDGFAPKDPTKVALVAQTTLGIYEWQHVYQTALQRFPELKTARKSDLCYATTNRQGAVEQLAQECDLVLVVGSHNSSNTQALVRVARERGARAERIDSAADIDPAWLEGVKVVGLTAGASAPDHLVQEVIDRLDPSMGFELRATTEEEEYFPLPRQLRAFVTTLQGLVEAGVTARKPAEPSLLERDREWTATEALDLISA
ncbi:MAG: 4-hydroxy-3-methylbut-2-enyl diphosphate reductase [Actinomycetes bacterium]|jgi:4-hydroxy-3-methylbut-2-enyl diphosphate reductase|nr:MAG: 4-hydroxy-3-methylbut-2-enyl diphosphate reductase [Actinomycetota bacterium]